MSQATSLTGSELIPIVQGGTNKTTTPSKIKEGLATTEQLNNKVDKDGSKVLSDQNFTTTLKNKLDGIEAQANKYTHPSTHPASIITEDTTHRFVTDTEKNTWNNKVDTSDITNFANKVSTENVAETTKELQPNKYYIFGEVETLTLTLAAGEENVLAEYMFEFTSGTTPTTITDIEGVEWKGDTIEADKVYQASISRGIGILIGRAKA